MNLLSAVIASLALGIVGNQFDGHEQAKPLGKDEPAAQVHIPEPSTLALAALGLAGIGVSLRLAGIGVSLRRRKQAAAR